MAPSRDLASMLFKDVPIDDDEVVQPKHSQALIPHPTVAALAVTPTPLAAGADLATILTGDFKNIKSLLTCSICDQLMYEPWTIACGHTYCYGCLAQWFETNSRRKTCPECRSPVRHMPAPAFVIRQIADIFTNRAEIMPAEESVHDHHQKRKEERDTVENDRNSMAGLFKGTFNGSHMARVIYDEADRIYRCAQCSHEFIPGPNCQNCGADFGGEEEGLQDDWSDDEDHDIDLDEVEMDYDLDGSHIDDDDMESDPELEEYRQHFENHGHFAGGAGYLHPAFRANRVEHNRLHQEFRQMFGAGPPGMPFPGEQDSSSDEEDSDEESEGSLEGFVVNEEEVHNLEDGSSDDEESEGIIGAPVNRRRGHHVIPIGSEDGNDEDGENEDDNTGPIQARQRQRHRNRRPAVSDDDDSEEAGEGDVWGVPSDGRRRSRPQVIDSDDSDSETTGGNSGVSLNRMERRPGRPTVDSESEAEPHEYDDAEGSSPMQNGDLSADEESHEINGYGEYESLQDESGNESDNTLRVEEHDEESFQWDDEVEVPSSDDEGHMRRPMAVPDPPTRRRRPWEEPLPARRGNRSQGGVQTGSGSRPISLDSDDDDDSGSEEEDEEEEYAGRDQDVEMSVSPSRTDQTAENEEGENLGNALNVHREEDHSSEDSLQPPRRRRRLRGLVNNDDEEDQDHDINLRSSPRQRMNQVRARYEPLAGRLTAALAGRSSESRPDPVSPSASRSRRRIQYAPNPLTLEPRRMTRTPRPPPAVSSYEYHGRTYQRFRPQDGYY